MSNTKSIESKMFQRQSIASKAEPSAQLMSTHTAISLELIQNALTQGAAAFRLVTALRPVGGDGDKVAPPTYATERRADKYAKETRVIDGKECLTVLLDSVQSQANRAEAALQDLYDAGKLDIPMVEVVFPQEFSDVGRVTVLQAPHRLADAILRDSSLDGVPWRESKPGKEFVNATVADARGVLALAPAALLLGMWDSTGERGGSGNKFARSIVSEIIGVGVHVGEKTKSRIDPLAIEKKGAKLYEHATETWTLDPGQAVRDDKEQPKVLKASDGTGDGSPSAVNHGNIAPSIDTEAGGVSIEYALQTSVLSLTRLRMLRFGNPPDKELELAARTYLAALGMACIVASRSLGCWLRSRCELVPIPERSRPLELVGGDGVVTQYAVPSIDNVLGLVDAAAAGLRSRGMLPEKSNRLRLTPSDKLLELLRRSRGMNPKPA